MIIRNMVKSDWNAVSHIYQLGIVTGNATFETQIPSWQLWNGKHHAEARLVAESDNEILGWAALLPVSDRKVYKGVTELSIYIHTDYLNKGIGTILMKSILDLSEKIGIWTVQAGIFPENKASIHLHHKFGFKTIGSREKIGQMQGVWRDVLLLERRSSLNL